MQAGLNAYPDGEPDDIHKGYWALNDVATCHLIKGKALMQLDRLDEAKVVFKRLINDFRYGQCWDPSGWFWKPAQAVEDEFGFIL